jgi:hypothetical protein
MRLHHIALVAAALLLHGCPGMQPADPTPDCASKDTQADSVPPDTADATSELLPGDPDVGLDVAPGTAWDEPVPLTLVGGLPLFDGAVDGGPTLPFLFDTLAQVVFLDEDIVGDVLYHEVDLVLGDDPLGTFQAKGRSMAPDEAFLGVDIAGLVGQAYIWKRFLVLDYPGGLFYQAAAPPDLETDPLPGWEGPPPWTVDVELQNAFPVIRPVLGEGAPVSLLADTSSPITTITRSVFDALDDGTLPQVAGYVWSSKYGTEEAFLTRLPSVRLGDLEVTGLEAAVIPDDHHLVTILGPNGVDVVGWLGAAFWERFVLGIDPKDGTEESPQVFYLWGDGAAPAKSAGRWDRVGVELAWRDDGIIVEMVFAGTDAEAQGIVVGDALVAVDGAPVEGVSLDALRGQLRGAPGEPRTLTVLHAEGDEEALTVLVEEILP